MAGSLTIFLCSSGNIAVSGHKDRTDQSYGDLVFDDLYGKLAHLMSSDEIKELRKFSNILDTKKDQSSKYGHETLKKKTMKKVLTVQKETEILYQNEAKELKTPLNNLGCLTTSEFSGSIFLNQKFANIYADMLHEQPTVDAGRFIDLVSVSSCFFICHPPKIPDEVIIENVTLKNLVVEWNNTEPIWPLDSKGQILIEEPSTGYVEEKFVKEETPSQGVAQALKKEETAEKDSEQKFFTVPRPGAPEQSPHIVHRERSLLQAQAAITQFGGILEIPDTGVVLRVPPNALPEGMSECLIKMRIIPINMSHDETTSFSSNSSVRVELLPTRFKFRGYVKLTLPHCLELKKNVVYRARVFMSHHNKGERPQWEEQEGKCCELQERICIIWLKSFCWTKFDIDDEIVEGKRLKLYTAAKKMYLEDMYAAVEVGYHLDMPGEQEILRMNPDLILSHRKPFVFLREGKHPLSILLRRIIPHQWKCNGQNTKEIPFQSVAASVEYSCSFVVEKETRDQDIPMCMFVAAQIQRIGHHEKQRTVDLLIRPEVHPFATPWDAK
ncbi:hypothetical protein HOLleu_36972 [Holothuria leucospilota]|uniref:Netrin receptor UNC5 n=1 Tax=Holothuria leucospilota TaxID=206669 RepID=A0A9Q0YKL9_HOLLE|nr:hypothetical protein HOLleu_36972 [Holothuria leucospilota]